MHFDLEEPRAMSEIGDKLRDLPSESAQPIHWDEFRRRQLLKRAQLRAAQRHQLTLVATVAIVMLGAIAMRSRLPSPQTLLAQRSTVAALPIEPHLAPVAWDESAVRSAASERWLTALPEEPVIVRVGTRAAVTSLEDRIAWVDDTLTSIRAEGGAGARAFALQHERDRLINSLAQVRYAESLAADLP
jgi:uracil-DNA glycosylase